MSQYIYIGQYYHKHGLDLQGLGITEKKIGLTKNINSREKALNSTKMTIGYVVVAAWEVQDMAITEKVMHVAFDDNRLDGEWFTDPNDDLIARVNTMINLLQIGTRVILDESREEDIEAKQAIKTASSSVEDHERNMSNEYIDAYLELKEGLIRIDPNSVFNCARDYISWKPNVSSKIVVYINDSRNKELIVDLGHYKTPQIKFEGFYEWTKSARRGDGTMRHWYGFRLNNSNIDKIGLVLKNVKIHYNDCIRT